MCEEKKNDPNNYEDIHYESIHNPESFWAKASRMVSWHKPWRQVLDNSDEPFTKWFVGGQINACYNAVDRHVNAGNGNKVALIYDSPLIGVVKKITYLELQEKVSKLAGTLSELGVRKGDRVIIYMPCIPETVIAMLATVRLGAIHSVVFGGFAAGELSVRIDHAEPQVVIAATYGLEPQRTVRYLDILEEALSISYHKPTKCIIYQRKQVGIEYLNPSRYLDWDDAIANGLPHTCVPIDANDTMYILYTSGTTGKPKGVQRPVGGHLVTLAWTMKYLYGVEPNDVWWTTSDFGWVVGHSYMCYAPLIYGVTSVIYEGKPTTTPDPSQCFRIVNHYKVNHMFTVPTVLRILKQADPDASYARQYDTSTLRKLWVAGEHCDINSKLWGEKIFGVPVSNHWWQTETGSAITAVCVGFDNPGKETKLTTGFPVPGYHIEVLRDDGSTANTGELGKIAVKLPMPPGTFSSLYRAPGNFVKNYFLQYPGYYDTQDAGFMDDDGLVYVTARADDVINVAGHRLSTLDIENIVLSHSDICDACVVSAPDDIKSEVPLCLFVMKNEALDEKLIRDELIKLVRDGIGPVSSFRLAVAVSALPVTRSGKICRKSIADLVRKKLTTISPTVVNPEVYEEIETVLKQNKILK